MRVGRNAIAIALVGVVLLTSFAGAAAAGLLKRTDVLESLLGEVPDEAIMGLGTALEAPEPPDRPDPAIGDPKGPPDWVPAGPPEGVPLGPVDWAPVGPPGWVPAGQPDETPVGPPDWLPGGPPYEPPIDLPDRPPVKPPLSVPLPLPFAP